MQKILAMLERESGHFNASIKRELNRITGPTRDMASYVTETGGKRVRPFLTLLSGRALGCEHPDLYTIGTAVEFLHSASLMHDDILDGAGTRRGKPSVHTVFGVTRTVLSGDVLCAVAVKIIAEMNYTSLSALLAEALANTASGQVEELSFLNSLDQSEDDYLRVITGKTAWLLRCACEMGAIRAGGSIEQVEAMAEFGLELGRAFQLVDDALDITMANSTGKPVGGDLREGKFTPPLRFYLETLAGSEREEFIRAFTTGNFDEKFIERAVRNMDVAGCGSKTRDMASKHLQKARAALAVIPPGPSRDLLYDMPEYIQNRAH